jgi:hypothetical protein
MPTPNLRQVAGAMGKGDRSKARELLTQILAGDLRNVDALLWMAAASETADERRTWLLRVLEIDSNNSRARRGLEVLGSVTQPVSEAEPSRPSTATTLSDQAFSQISQATPETIIEARPKELHTVQQPIKGNTRQNSKATFIITVAAISVALMLFVVGYALSVGNHLSAPQQSYNSPLPTDTPEPTRTPLPPTKRPIPTEKKDPWPALPSLSSYPLVSGLDLLKRPFDYKDKTVCLLYEIASNVTEDENGTTTFTIQDSDSDTVIGTVFYPGSMKEFVDDWMVSIGGYVVGTESDLGVSSSFRPVIMMQQGAWYAKKIVGGMTIPNLDHGYSVGADERECK